MEIQYKPTKEKKVKPAKTPKSPKVEMASNPISFGSTKSVKIDKPKKEKKPKVKAPKSEKAQTMTFGKPGKVDAGSKSSLNKPLKPGVIIAILAVFLAVVIGAVTYVILSGPASDKYDSDILKMEITNPPKKLEYYVGERPNYSGMEITVTMKNGEKYSLRASDCSISGFDSSAATDKLSITVMYQDYHDSFYIRVKERPQSTPVLKSISIKDMPKTEYKLGDSLDTSEGMLRCEYSDGSFAYVEMSNNYIVGYSDIKQAGKYTLTVRYKEDTIVVTTTYDIIVTE